MAKKPIYQQLGELSNMVNNPEMVKWAERLDAAGHGAKASATHIRVNLAAVMKTAKALRAEIQARKNLLK
jgi:hypothetical protein